MLVQKEQLFIEFSRVRWEDVGAGIRRKVMAYGDQLMAVYVEFQRGAIGALHRHPHLQITYIQSGSLTVHIGDEHRVLRGGDFYYIPADVEHGVDALEDSVLIDFFTPMRAEFVPAQTAGA
jgi:quercetin dioxygenase-like cupin family protein